MPTKHRKIQERLAAFMSNCAGSDSPEIQLAAKKALSDRHYLMVARAADIIRENLYYDLESALLAAYQRFLKNPVKNDPNCVAKSAIVQALVELDSKEEDFFVSGMRYRQMEPVWGGTADTATGIRISSAFGLTNTSYPRTPIELVALLYDPEEKVRKGAARAASNLSPYTAEVMLRGKVLSGDIEPSVTGEAIAMLLRVAPEASMQFVANFLNATMDPMLRETIAFALGESQRDEALTLLQDCWDEEPLKTEQTHMFLRGAIFHRSKRAFSWLMEVVAEGDKDSARFIVEELAIYRKDQNLKEKLKVVVDRRNDALLKTHFSKIWR